MPKENWNRFAKGLLIVVCAALVWTGTLLGQGTTGTITGVVSDSSGAVIPNAAVSIMNEGTGVDLHLKTNSAGIYSITSLIPGYYSVKVEATGFKTHLNQHLQLTTDQTIRVDTVLEVGSQTQTVTVEASAPLVNTEEGRLSALVSASQIQNMPLNGRNIYDLMQLVPGAINSTGVDLENASAGGSATNVNGNRLTMNQFQLDGVDNTGLTGGSDAQPSPDFVAEFRIMTNNFSSQYGAAGGSVTDVSIKSGTNQFHGAAWEYLRNTSLNARNFFSGPTKDPWHQNQFGADLGGPIKKDKLFFFGGYEGERFRTNSPGQYLIETQAFRTAVQTINPNSVASALYQAYPGPTPTSGFKTVDAVINKQAVNDIGANVGGDYFGDGSTNTLISNAYVAYTDPCFLNQWNYVGAPAYPGGPPLNGSAQTVANTMGALVGVTQAEHDQIQSNINAACPGMGLVAPGVQAGAIGRDAPMLGLVNASVPTRGTGEFYNGDQFTGRIDYQGDKNRVFGRIYYLLQKDPNRTTASSQVRKFYVPFTASFPGGAFGFVHNFSGNVVNEFRAGYIRNQLSYIPAKSTNAVPAIGFDSGDVQFGAYNGYPQFFNENVYNYSDMVAILKGKHSLKIGASYKRNQENSEFNVGRPSYYFYDQFYFAADAPYWETAGVNPELGTGNPSHIDTNIRAWRNYELGLYVQDDWKVSKNFTLNLGLRYDYFQPNHEKYGKTTNFDFAQGANAIERLANINCQAFLSASTCLAPAGDTFTPNGGFTHPANDLLFAPDRNNFSPRFGFAWDPRGNGKTAIRGGFAVFFQRQIYNPLSNSRWNLPYYSFNKAVPVLGSPGQIVYGPFASDGVPDPTQTVSLSGPPTNPGGGPAALGFTGNIYGWWPGNTNLASLTGIPDPTTRSPYVENGFFGIQHQLSNSTMFEVNWVGTFGHKIFWAQDPNRVVGGLLRDPSTITDPCTGQPVEAPTAKVNPCFGSLRTWTNSVNSNYNALQTSLVRKLSGGLGITSAYTWSHTLDFRSDWQALSGGGSANWANPYGSAGYSLDPNAVYLEYGNSSFDVRHRWVTSVVWELPWMKSQQGVAGRILGGWQSNFNIQLQSGFPFTVGASSDYNKDGLKNDRPDIPTWGNHFPFKNANFLADSAPGGATVMSTMAGDFNPPTPGHDGTLGRNTFRGPGLANVDFSLFKGVKFSERLSMQFRAEFFNLFNRTNLYPPEANLNSDLFGFSNAAFDPRVIQFGLRLEY